MQDLVGGTQFDSMLYLFAVQRSEKLYWSVDVCLGWYHYELRGAVDRGVSAYRKHGQEFSKSNTSIRVYVTAWTMKKSVEELKRAGHRPDVRSCRLIVSLKRTTGRLIPFGPLFQYRLFRRLGKRSATRRSQ